MSLVFGFPNTKNLAVSDRMTMLGLNLLRCDLSKIQEITTVSANQPAYKNYVGFLPSYMRSYTTRAKTSIIDVYHPLNWAVSNPCVPLSAPDVVVSFSGVPPTEVLEAIRGVGASEMSVKGTKSFLIPSPDAEILRTVAAAGASRTTPAPVNAVNLAALGSISLIRRLFSNFFYTHQYPAFADQDHFRQLMNLWKIAESNPRKRGKEPSGAGPSRKKQRKDSDGEDMDDSDAEDDDDSNPADPSNDKIIYAVPPDVIHTAWGDDTDVPTGDGLLLRFVEETQQGQSEKMVNIVIAKYFMGCLGANAQSARDAFDKIRTDFGVIQTTRTGKQLAHMAKCIDIGLSAQARVFPVILDGQYMGCVLLGYGFQIAVGRSVHGPVSRQLLSAEIGKLQSHGSSLATIATIACGDDGMHIKRPGIVNASTMVELREALQLCTTTEEERTQIVTAARGLKFSQSHWNVSPSNIVEALRLIATPEESIGSSVPISYRMLFETDRTILVWSAFGEMAPTPNFAGGSVVDLTKSKDLPSHIAFRITAFKDAIIDIQKILADKKFLAVSNNRRAGPVKDRVYTGNDGKRIVQALCTASGSTVSRANDKSRGPEVVMADTVFDDGF